MSWEQWVEELIKSSFAEVKKVESIPLEQEEDVYASAYVFYTQGHYEKASSLFLQLCFTNPFDGRHWVGLASSLQMQKEWKKALHAWGYAALLDDTDPTSHFHAGECLFQCGEKEEAEKALNQAILRLSADKGVLKNKIETMQKLLEGSDSLA